MVSMPCCCERRHVLGHVAPRQQAAVDLRVQRLHAAVEHLGKAGVLGHLGDRQAGVGQQLGGAAGGQQLDAERVQRAREFDDAGLVGDGDQCVHGYRGATRARHLISLCSTQLRAQRVAVDAQPFGGAALVAVGLLHHHFEQRLLDHAEDHLVHRRRLDAAQVLEIALQAVADALFDVLLVASCVMSFSAASSSASRRRRARQRHARHARRPVRRRSRRPRAACASQVSSVFMRARKASPPGSAAHGPADVLARGAHAGEFAVQRVVVVAGGRAASRAPRRPAAAAAARRSPGNARSRGRSTAGPAPRGRSSWRRRRSRRSTSRAFSRRSRCRRWPPPECARAAFTAAMVSYSAWPL